MQKYKIEITQKEKYLIDVYATSETEATELAQEAYSNGNYQETGDIETETTAIYDVTNTDDPFYPINDSVQHATAVHDTRNYITYTILKRENGIAYLESEYSKKEVPENELYNKDNYELIYLYE